MRLTDNEFHSKENKERACYIQEPRIQAIYDKLFDLEDIEEELGIDLLTLFKAFKQGFYFKDDFGNIDFISGNVIKQLNKDKYEEIMKDLHNYGKNWALAKEELL